MRLPVGEVLIVSAAVAGAGPDELMGRAAEAMTAAGCAFTGQIVSAPRGEDLDRWGRAPGLEEELVRGAPERAAAQAAERGRHVVRTGWSRRGGGPMALSICRPPEPELLLVDLVMAAGALGLEPGARSGRERSYARSRWSLAVRLLRALAQGAGALYAGAGTEMILPLPGEFAAPPPNAPGLWWVSSRLEDARGEGVGAALAGTAKSRSTPTGALIQLHDPVRGKSTGTADAQARLLGFMAEALGRGRR